MQTGPIMIMVEAATEEDLKKLIQAPQLQNQGYAFQKVQFSY